MSKMCSRPKMQCNNKLFFCCWYFQFYAQEHAKSSNFIESELIDLQQLLLSSINFVA